MNLSSDDWIVIILKALIALLTAILAAITTSAFVLACSGDIPPETTTRLIAALVAGGLFTATA